MNKIISYSSYLNHIVLVGVLNVQKYNKLFRNYITILFNMTLKEIFKHEDIFSNILSYLYPIKDITVKRNQIKNGYFYFYGKKNVNTIGNNNYYMGSFLNGVASGYGKLLVDKKILYDGEWKYNQMHGKGKKYYDNKIIYKGEFKNNKRNGRGEEYKNNKIIYGFWINNKLTIKYQ